MSGSDWWTSSTQNSFNTPQRPSSVPNPSGYGHQSTSRARFQGDELDPEDEKMAEGIKFMPSFSSSQAGKAILGGGSSSSNMGMGIGSVGSPIDRMGGGSPVQSRRSPGSISSPRAGRATRQTPAAIAMEEDGPPTTSLRDAQTTSPPHNTSASGSGVGSTSISPPNNQSHSSGLNQASLPLPPGLIPTSETTTLHVFGPPIDQLKHLEPYLEQIGEIKRYEPGPNGSNWYIVEYTNPTSALYALRRHGEVVNGRWMLGFKVATSNSSSSGYNTGENFNLDYLQPQQSHSQNANGGGGNGNGNGNGNMIRRSGAGTPMRVQSTPSMGLKQTPHQVVKRKAVEEYAWDENEQPSGIVNRAAEWLFGR